MWRKHDKLIVVGRPPIQSEERRGGMAEEWMVAAAYSIVPLLPGDPVEPNAVLAIVHSIVDNVAEHYVRPRRGRGPRLLVGQSGARLKAQAPAGGTNAARP